MSEPSQLELDLPADAPFPGEDDPKALRTWVFEPFVKALEQAAESAGPSTPERVIVPRDVGPVVDYLEARARQLAFSQAARWARAAMLTREERLIRERENSRLSPPSDAELACARHHETCAICRTHEDIARRQAQETHTLEAVRLIYLGCLHNLIRALAVAEGDRKLAEAISNEIQRITDRADARWRK